MHSPDCSITPDDWPHGYGFCWCGCGQKTSLASRSQLRLGVVKGRPVRYRVGHGNRGATRPISERFWEKVDVRGPDDCWNWIASTYSNGYGQFQIGLGKNRCAHRIAWEMTNGPIAADLTVDHLCKNPRCQNPGHMEIVTRGENCLRGGSPAAENRRKTTCKHGHAFTPRNTYVDKNGGRACRTCHRINESRRRNEKAVHCATIVH